MPYSIPITGSFLSLLLAGAIAGFFYAWSVSAMWGLDTADPRHAIGAMQQINVAVRNPVFFASFFGMPIVTALTALLFVERWK